MKSKWKVLLSNLKSLKWKNLLLFAIACFYIGLIVIWDRDSDSPMKYGGDFIAFWSAGKIADVKGYSEIYDLNNLRGVQSQEFFTLGLLKNILDLSVTPIPAPILSFFVLPFQVLSKIELGLSYWIWTVVNLVILIGYLVFFLKRILPENLRVVFVMRDQEGLSIQETAEALDLSENNIKTRLLRARLRLRQELSVYFRGKVQEKNQR